MKLLVVFALFALVGCKDCNNPNNPTSPEHPCGTRAHPCSLQPLLCCWNDEVCGGPVGTGCPANMCCFVGDDFSASASPSASPGAKPVPQWSVGRR
jgi:hypothetical protein